MNLKELSAVFVLESHNFKMMHWLAKGSKFDTIHKLAEEYYDMISEDLDTIAECSMILDFGVPCYAEVLSLLKETEVCDYEIIDGDKDIDWDLFIDKCDAHLKCILTSIKHTLDNISDSDVGIKSELEGLYAKYELHCKYLNKRRH